MIELKNSKTTYLGKASGGDKYALDAFIGAVQMRDPVLGWQDIKPRLVKDLDGWHIEGAPYYAEVKDNGDRLFCPDKTDRSKYIRLPSIALFSSLTKNIVSLPSKLDGQSLAIKIAMPTSYGSVNFQFTNTGMYLPLELNSAPVVASKTIDRLTLDVDSTFDIQRLIESESGLGIVPGYVVDALGVERRLEWTYKDGQLELGFDLTGLKFPVTLMDAIDVQVNANVNDGIVSGASTFNNAANWQYAGMISSAVNHSFALFTGITIPQGSTIDACTYIPYFSACSGSPLTKVYFELALSPSVVADYDDFFARSLTSGVDWDGAPANGEVPSPSLAVPMKQLVDAYDLNNSNVQVFHKDDGSASPNNYQRAYSRDQWALHAVKLHIEYTAGGGTAKTSAETGAGDEVITSGNPIVIMDKTETGSGLESLGSRDLGQTETGSGLDISSLLAAFAGYEIGSGMEAALKIAAFISSDGGVGSELGWLLKEALSGDGGGGYDALKALIKTSGSGSDMRLTINQGQVARPHKEVSL